MPRRGYRASHCKNGHARTPENVNSKGYCIQCSRDYYRKWRNEHKEEGRAAARKWKYGVTSEQFEAMLERQDYRCAVCRQPFDFSSKRMFPHVDHSHADQTVRGLLCDRCNKGLGNFCDSVENLKAAISYLSNVSGGTVGSVGGL